MAGSQHPVVVIGAGLAGLAAALAVARSGRGVVVLEAGDAVGGCCSTVGQSGFTFNNGALYVAVPSLLRHAFGRLGLDFDAEVPMARIERPHATWLDDGTQVRLSTVDASSVEGAAAQRRTGDLREGLGTLQREWAPVYRALVEDVLPFEPSLPRVLRGLWRHLGKLRGSVDARIERYFPDPALQAAVASILLYTGQPPQRLPASQIIGLLALLEEGFHLPHGGMGAIPNALARGLAACAVPVRTGARATRILAEGGRVRGVQLADGALVRAGAVVATCSALEVVDRLLPAADVPGPLRRKAARAPLSHRAISIQLGCTAEAFPDAFIVNHVPPMRRQGEMHLTGAGVPDWLAYTRPTQVLPALAPGGKSIVEFHAPATGVRSASDWTGAMTARVVDDYVAGLRRRVPGLDVEVLRTLDPHDFSTRRFLYEGALYGLAPGVPPDRFFPHRTRVGGLYLAGQTTFPGYGVSGALLSGIQAADALLRAGPRQ